MSADKPFTKENLDSYLRELAKEFRKKNGTFAEPDNKNYQMQQFDNEFVFITKNNMLSQQGWSKLGA